MPSELEDRLRTLHRPAAPGQDEHRRAHEDALMAAHARRYGAPPARRWPRLALGGVLGVAVAVGACALPAEYPVSLGYELRIRVDASRWSPRDQERITHVARDLSGAERVELRVEQHIEQRVEPVGSASTVESVQVQLLVFGDAIDPEAMWSQLQEDCPALVDAEVHDVPLSGTVHGTLGGKLSHDWLDVVLDQHGVEEAERRILAELAAEGIDPQSATVDIEQSTDAQGHRRIEVRVEAEP